MRLNGSVFALAIANTLVNNQLRSVLESLMFSPSIVEIVLDDPTTILSGLNTQISFTDAERTTIIHFYTKGVQWTFLMTACACGAALLTGIFVIQAHSLDRPDDKEIKERSRVELKSSEKMKGPSAEQTTKDEVAENLDLQVTTKAALG